MNKRIKKKKEKQESKQVMEKLQCFSNDETRSSHSVITGKTANSMSLTYKKPVISKKTNNN